MILVALPAALVALASLLAFAGSWWWAFDLVANLRPQYAGVLVVAGAGLIIGRWRRIGVGILAVGLLNAALVAPLYLAPDTRGAVTGERVRVVTFNVHSANRDHTAVADWLRQVDADVVFLHETTSDWEEALAVANLGYEITRSQAPELIFGTLVLAPVGAEVTGLGFTVGEPRAVEVRLTTERGTEISLLGIHPLSPDTETRALLRDAQLRFAGEWAATQPTRAVVAGDFNATPWSHAFRRLLRLGDLIDSQRGFGLQPTFPTTQPVALRVPIDHLLHTDGLHTVDRRLGPALGSDHLPVMVDLAITTRDLSD